MVSGNLPGESTGLIPSNKLNCDSGPCVAEIKKGDFEASMKRLKENDESSNLKRDLAQMITGKLKESLGIGGNCVEPNNANFYLSKLRPFIPYVSDFQPMGISRHNADERLEFIQRWIINHKEAWCEPKAYKPAVQCGFKDGDQYRAGPIVETNTDNEVRAGAISVCSIYRKGFEFAEDVTCVRTFYSNK